MGLLTVIAVGHKIKCMVICYPYIVSLQVVIHTLYVRYVRIGHSLFAVSHQRNYCLRKLFGLPAKTTLGGDIG